MTEDDENLKEWLDELDEEELHRPRANRSAGPDDSEPEFESRAFRRYMHGEKQAAEENWYERWVHRTAFFSFVFEDMEEDLRNAINLLQWDVEPDRVAPAALVMALLIFPISISILLLVSLPALLNFIIISLPFIAFFYMTYYPKLRAKQKVITASEELILAILYMAIYLRSSPVMEGALTFAARHLEGPVSKDFSRVLWKLDMRVDATVEEAVEDYVDRWKPYNKGFVESLNLLNGAVNAQSEEKRKEMLGEAIDNILSFTKQEMESFARQLKLPVMVLHGVGILLPVLGIILFPLVANFMGAEGMIYYLALLYNVMLPGLVFFVMRTLLVGRPVTFSSQSANLRGVKPGHFSLNLLGDRRHMPAWAVSVPLFVLLAWWPLTHYVDIIMGNAAFAVDPDPMTMMREMLLPFAIAVPAGLHYMLGYRGVVRKQKDITEMEKEFPEALFELGYALEKGMPIEHAVDTAAKKRRSLDISALFRRISENIQQYSMTFEQAVYDDKIGAIQEYPSQLIGTVMNIISESVQRGPRIAANSVLAISRYLKNISETQQKMEELLGETVSSVRFLGFIVAPVIAGIAVGMGSVLSQAFSLIGRVAPSNQSVNASADAGQVGGAGGFEGGAGLLGVFNLDAVIAPGMLQLVVGIYLIQISLLIGKLVVTLQEGQNTPVRKYTTGKLLLVAIPFYTITSLIVLLMFGGILSSVQVS